MKKDYSLMVAAITLILIGMVVGIANIPASAQKPTKATTVTIDSLGTAGATVFYQLTDAEGGSQFTYSNGSFVRKVPAIVSFDPHGTRGADGRLIFSVTVFRPLFLGGTFDKDNVSFDSGRNPGTIDTVQSGDIYE